MSERDKRIAVGLAAGAAVAGAAAMFGHKNKGRASSAAEAKYPDEETSGRGQPAGGPDPESRESGYELKDANVRTLAKVIIVSVALIIGSLTIVFFVFSRFDRAFREPNKDLTAEQRAPLVPPQPHLQAAPYHDIDAVLMEQTQRLTTYGWNGSDHKTGHIPIERAMQQVIGKPLDASAQADAAGPKGSDAPQPATPGYDAGIPRTRPANRIQGEGNLDAVTPSVTEPLTEPKP